MITEKEIKPIPKYIEKEIKKHDINSYGKYSCNTRFYSYLIKYKNEIGQMYVAVKNKGKDYYFKQVALHLINSKECLVKDIAYFTIGGYRVGWYEQGLNKYKKWYEGDWDLADDKYFNMYAPVVNKEYALKFNKYKYSAVDKYWDTNIIKYLRYYNKYPIAELLVKIGLDGYATSKMILDKLTKDKNFRKWIIKTSSDISLNGYYVSTILSSYKTGKNLKEVQEYETFLKSIYKEDYYEKIKELFNGNIEQFFNYVNKQDINLFSYSDYLNACEYLQIDMNLEKNLMPHNFKKWHDIRIDQYHSKKAELEKIEREKFYTKFKQVANKYISLERLLVKDDYICLIAKSPKQLVYEGKELNHCVGRMNYDQKFVREETLIFFIRNRLSPNTPFVTLEYSLDKHKVLQCYGNNDTRPAEDVLEFVNKKWLPYANRKLKKIA